MKLYIMTSNVFFAGILLAIGTSPLAYKIWLRIKKHLSNRRHRLLPSRKDVYINGLSCCFPPNRYTQTQMRDMFIKNYCSGEENITASDLNFIHRVFSAALIETCYVNLPESELFIRMERQRYTEYVKKSILMMACESAKAAIKNTNGITFDKITHLVFGTMTATIGAPSMDIHIARELKLNADIKRLNVEAMGCLTGFRLVGLCRDIALQSVDNIVLLVVCDIRSALGNQMTPFIAKQAIDKSNVIVAALFRDACGAAVFSQVPSKHHMTVADHRSFLIENTLDLGRLREFNDGSIHLYLDKKLPYAVFDNIPKIVYEMLDQHEINIEECQFAIHTGGPKIIRGVQNCLNLKVEQLCGSWFVMFNYGNLSGSSNLIVVEHLYRWKYSSMKPQCDQVIFPDSFSKYKFIVGLSFGPGVAVECVLLQYP